MRVTTNQVVRITVPHLGMMVRKEMIILDREVVQEHIDCTQLKNGWVISMVSDLTPGTIRVQLMPPIAEVRKTVEGETLDEALEEAKKFSEITESEYIRWLFGG